MENEFIWSTNPNTLKLIDEREKIKRIVEENG